MAVSTSDQVGETGIEAVSGPAARSSVLALGGVLLLATWLAYANSLTGQFLFDDHTWLEQRPLIRDLSWEWQRLSINRPLPLLSMGLNFVLGGLDVRGYHVFNITVHALAGLLLFGTVRRTIEWGNRRRSALWNARGLAFAVALIWLVHPLQTQSVTYVIQRCESMMGMFFFLCLYCIVRGADSRRAWFWYGTAVIACCLGLGCKEVMVAAAPVALLFDRAFLASSWREVFRRRGLLHAVLLGVAVTFVLLSLNLIREDAARSAGFGYEALTPLAYLRSQPGVILHYLRLSFWPRPLCLDYQWPVAGAAREVYPAAAAVAALLVAGAVAFRYRPGIGFLGLSFFLVLAPTSSIMPIRDLAVEHRMYVPLAAVLSLVVLGLYGLGRSSLRDPPAQRLAAVAGLTAVAFTFTIMTWQRNGDYRDRIRTWSRVIEVAPHNIRAHYSLAQAYRAVDDLEAARRYYERCLALDPDHARAHCELGNVLASQGDLQRAGVHLRRAIALDPQYSRALANYGDVLQRQNRVADAIFHYRRVLELPPTDSRFRQASRRRPTYVSKFQLAWVLATTEEAILRNGAEAVQLAEEVSEESGRGDARPLDVLAAAYAEAGRFDDACRTAAEALELATAKGPKEDVEAIRQRLELYRDRKPFRENNNARAVGMSSDGSEDGVAGQDA